MNTAESARHENMLSAMRANNGKYTKDDVEALCSIAVAGALRGVDLQTGAMRNVMERLVAKKPTVTLHGARRWRCQQCDGRWAIDADRENHLAECAYVMARDALTPNLL